VSELAEGAGYFLQVAGPVGEDGQFLPCARAAVTSTMTWRVRSSLAIRSQDAASAALEALASPTAGPEPGLSTGEWHSRWLASRLSLRASTSRGYKVHVRSYLLPYLGGIPLAALTAGDVQAMFTAVTRQEGALGRPVSAATLHRIHATLRAALNGAVRAGLISVNPGRQPGAAQGCPAPAAGLHRPVPSRTSPWTSPSPITTATRSPS
jgi:Phage integrase, N-terminal SAM-like domain